MTAPVAAPRRAVPDADRGPAPLDPARWGRHPLVRVPTLAIGALIATLLLAGCTFVMANLLVRTTETDTETFTGPVRRVDVHVSGDVTITAGGSGGARVDRRSTFGVSRPRLTQTLEDGLLTVRVECPGGISVVCDNRVDIEVPADASLAIDALGTRIADITGDIDINSGAGTVELDGVSGDVDANVGGGSIVGIAISSARVQATAGAGSVDLEFAVPPDEVNASSGAGSVVIELPPGAETYRVDADAGAGEDVVSVATDPTSDRAVRVNAGAGSVEVRYAV